MLQVGVLDESNGVKNFQIFIHLVYFAGIRAVPMVHVGWSPSLINEMTHQQIGDMTAYLMKKEKENTRPGFFL
jgi:hypothetical protein